MKTFFCALLALVLPMTVFGYVPHHGSCSGEITVEGEWIYFSPTSESTFYVVPTPRESESSNPNGERRANRLDDFYSGYRVAAAYDFCNRYVAVTWTSLKATHDDSDTNDFLFPTATPGAITDSITGNFASQSHRLTYYALDSVIGQTIICGNCFNLDFFYGVQYAHLFAKDFYFYDMHEKDFNIAPFIQGTERETFWGVGPEIGLSFVSPIWCGFALNGQSTTALLIGQPNTTSNFFNNELKGGNSNVQNTRAYRVVPFLDLRLGVEYDYCLNTPCFGNCFPRLDFTLSAGYEALVYFNALSRYRTLAVTQDGLSFDEYRNVAMHGPYISLALTF